MASSRSPHFFFLFVLAALSVTAVSAHTGDEDMNLAWDEDGIRLQDPDLSECRAGVACCRCCEKISTALKSSDISSVCKALKRYACANATYLVQTCSPNKSLPNKCDSAPAYSPDKCDSAPAYSPAGAGVLQATLYCLCLFFYSGFLWVV